MGNKSLVAGVLCIVSGAMGLLLAGVMILTIFSINFASEMVFEHPREIPIVSLGTIYFLGIFWLICGLLEFVGGIFAILKKYWGFGLAAAIAGIFTFFPCGIAAIIMIGLGKGEFARSTAVFPSLSQTPIKE